MRVVVTGTQGQVARALQECSVRFPGTNVVAVGRPKIELTELRTIRPAIVDLRPDLIVHAAAYTAVDNAESEPEQVFAINRDGAAEVATIASDLSVPLVYLSTDYVFSGGKAAAYVESDETGPLGVYGQSKLEGEHRVRSNNPEAIILRTSWVYGPFGSNFVKTMLRLAGEKSQLHVVNDQIGNPTSAIDLAEAILKIAPRLCEKVGAGSMFHLVGRGSVSWYGFARQILETSSRLGGPSAVLVPISSAEYSARAPRPANSSLNCAAFNTRFGFELPRWQESVDHVVRLLLAQLKRDKHFTT